MTAEPPLAAADFAFVQRLTIERSGLDLLAGKEYLVESRLRPVAESFGADSIAGLIERARRGSEPASSAIVEAMATQETYFFRDTHPFETLRQEILPDVISRAGTSGMTIWSAAAATGQEAYSVAMLLREHFPTARASILATDFSQLALARASRGTYSQLEVNRGLPAKMLIKYFNRDGRSWEVKPELKQLITFRELNLINPFPPLPKMDVILLRNVLTYFEPATKKAVLGRIAKVLTPGGYLLLGGSETTYGLDPAYERVHSGGHVYYRLKAEGDIHA